MLAPRPAAGSALAFLQFLLGPANATVPGRLLLGRPLRTHGVIDDDDPRLVGQFGQPFKPPVEFFATVVGDHHPAMRGNGVPLPISKTMSLGSDQMRAVVVQFVTAQRHRSESGDIGAGDHGAGDGSERLEQRCHLVVAERVERR